jgi:hypothetical protein
MSDTVPEKMIALEDVPPGYRTWVINPAYVEWLERERERTGPEHPDTSMVICPRCTSQFHAISVDDQTHRAALERDAARLRQALQGMIEVAEVTVDTQLCSKGILRNMNEARAAVSAQVLP